MDAVIVIGNNYTYDERDFQNKYVIAVDKGALYCMNNNIKMDLAVGDFDSISLSEYNKLLSLTKVIKLNPIKDETDTMVAINQLNNYENIYILGGITGKRIEHFYANLLLLKNDIRLKMKDDCSFIFTIDSDTTIAKSVYKFASIFSLSDSTISLVGFKYNLDNYKLLPQNPLGVSNEITNETAKIKLKGKLLVILSKDDNI